jgi:hypothetical protein
VKRATKRTKPALADSILRWSRPKRELHRSLGESRRWTGKCPALRGVRLEIVYYAGGSRRFGVIRCSDAFGAHPVLLDSRPTLEGAKRLAQRAAAGLARELARSKESCA